MLLTVKPYQTMLDMAIQGCGDASRLLEIALLNDKSITDDINAGDQIVTPDSALEKRQLVIYFNRLENLPASGKNVLALGGIGYMQIGNDFKIS